MNTANVELSEESIDYTIPQNRWNWRKIKRKIQKRARALTPHHSYALGCRGHPGMVIERRWASWWKYTDLFGADVAIKSLVDGVEESCSIFSCAPQPITRAEAERRAEEIKTIHAFDLSVKYGYSVEEVKKWAQDWVDRGVLYYVLTDQHGQTVRSARALTKEEAEADVTNHERLITGGRYHGNVTNPRMVEMLTYPASIKSFQLG